VSRSHSPIAISVGTVILAGSYIGLPATQNSWVSWTVPFGARTTGGVAWATANTPFGKLFYNYVQTANGSVVTEVHTTGKRPRIRLQPYLHRATEIVLAYQRGLVATTAVGTSVGPVAARAGQLRRRLAGCGFALNENLLEVSPAATLNALVGRKRTRATRRDTDAWAARATVLEGFGDLAFAPTSKFAREDALRSLHVFDALVAGYTAYRWAKDGWELPAGGVFDEDGWVWTP